MFMFWGIIASVILSGVSLAMDAFAVSICDGMVYRNLTKGKAVVMPTVFGIFQAVMPIIGFYICMAFSRIDAFDAVDHWIAFALLFIIGGKMIYDGIKELRAKEEELKPKQFSLPEVLVQGVATSIDALFVGFSYAYGHKQCAGVGVDKRRHNRRNHVYNFSRRRNNRREGGAAFPQKGKRCRNYRRTGSYRDSP